LKAETKSEGSGIGLRNTRDRLERLFGAEYRFDVRNRALRGAEVTLTIPLRFAAEEVSEA
jgi:sensor histidine kinase YesM